MSRASTERDAAVETMTLAVNLGAFTKQETEAMLMEAFKCMTVTELNQLVAKNTRYEDLMDVEVMM